MSKISKDAIIKGCADAYRASIGKSDKIKAGELTALLASRLPSSYVDIGTFIPSSNTGDFDVPHKLGVTPDIVIGWVDVQDMAQMTLAFVKVGGSNFKKYVGAFTGTSASGYAVATAATTAEDTSNTFRVPSGNYMSALTYNYIAAVKVNKAREVSEE